MSKKEIVLSNGRAHNIGSEYPSTVGRGKAVTLEDQPKCSKWFNDLVCVWHGNAFDHYASWDEPAVIVSDGGYGILGFEGDPSDHLELAQWYEPHIEQWAKRSLPSTTLWFWNSEIGWAIVHPILEKHGWRYINANIWNKGTGHVAGNVNTRRIRRFPVVSEVCVHYSLEPRISGRLLKHWLFDEWKRTGLPIKKANEACGVRDAAVRKYLHQGHLWYFPPPERFQRMSEYANRHGAVDGRPYFSIDGHCAGTADQWKRFRPKFFCPHGVTNVWDRPPLHGKERIKAPNGRAVHLNQKPLDLMQRIIEASSEKGDVIWEPFGGLFSGVVAASMMGRKAFAAETDSTYFQYGLNRIVEATHQNFVRRVPH